MVSDALASDALASDASLLRPVGSSGLDMTGTPEEWLLPGPQSLDDPRAHPVDVVVAPEEEEPLRRASLSSAGARRIDPGVRRRARHKSAQGAGQRTGPHGRRRMPRLRESLAAPSRGGSAFSGIGAAQTGKWAHRAGRGTNPRTRPRGIAPTSSASSGREARPTAAHSDGRSERS